MAIQTRRQSLTQARLLFNQQGAVPGGMVAEPILRSWRRCADLFRHARPAPRRAADPGRAARGPRAQRGAAPHVRSCHGRAAQACARAGRPGDPVRFARPGAGLRRRPGFRPARIAHRPDARLSLGRGRGWHQCHRHGAGRGPFHRRARGRALFRAQPHPDLRGGAGVRQPGRILGVLDLSSQAGGIRPDALALVRAAVDQIEHRLFAQAHERDTVLRLHADPAGLGRRARRCWPSGATCWSGPTGWRCGRWNSRPRRWACIAMKTCSKTR